MICFRRRGWRPLCCASASTGRGPEQRMSGMLWETTAKRALVSRYAFNRMIMLVDCWQERIRI